MTKQEISIDELPEGIKDVASGAYFVKPKIVKPEDSARELGTPLEAQPACLLMRIAKQSVMIIKRPGKTLGRIDGHLPTFLDVKQFGLRKGSVHPFVEGLAAVVIDPEILQQEEVYFSVEEWGDGTAYARIPGSQLEGLLARYYPQVSKRQDIYRDDRGDE
jgi:hypothetical protein